MGREPGLLAAHGQVGRGEQGRDAEGCFVCGLLRFRGSVGLEVQKSPPEHDHIWHLHQVAVEKR